MPTVARAAGIIALLINILLNRRPLYKVEETYSNMDTETLFGPGISWHSLNDDALDKVAEADPEKVYQSLVFEVLSTESVTINALHVDTASVSVHGKYDIDDDETALKLTFGYSKDKRPDLKQFMYVFGVTKDGIPVMGKVLDGNKSDMKWNEELLKKLPEYLQAEGKRPVYVADAALVSKDNLKVLSTGKHAFISRLPGRFKLEKDLINRTWECGKWQSLGALVKRKDTARYRVCCIEDKLYDHCYRFLVVNSTSLDRRKTKGLEKRLDEAEENLEKELEKIQKRQFACEPDARETWRVFEKEHKDLCFLLEYKIETEQKRKNRKRPGRPPRDYVPEYEQVYRIEPRMRRNIQKEREKASCFVLISKLSSKDITDEHILRTYKEQTVVEQHFAFIKDPIVVGPVYMKKPQRVEALAYVFS